MKIFRVESWTNGDGPTFYLGMADRDWVGDPTKLVFSIALYGDGTVAIGGKEPTDGMTGVVAIMRTLADAFESGDINWTTYWR